MAMAGTGSPPSSRPSSGVGSGAKMRPLLTERRSHRHEPSIVIPQEQEMSGGLLLASPPATPGGLYSGDGETIDHASGLNGSPLASRSSSKSNIQTFFRYGNTRIDAKTSRNTSQESKTYSVYDTDTANGRPRGESDLSRPAVRTRNSPSEFPRIVESTPTRYRAPSEPGKSLSQELIVALLIPLPFLLSSIRPLTSLAVQTPNDHKISGLYSNLSNGLTATSGSFTLFEAFALAAGSLILVGITGHFLRRRDNSLRQWGDKMDGGLDLRYPGRPDWRLWKPILLRIAAVALPFVATAELGGVRVGIFMLAAAAEGLIAPDPKVATNKSKWKRLVSKHKWLAGLFFASLSVDVFWAEKGTAVAPIVRGYAALVKATVLLKSPLTAPPVPLSHGPTSPLIASSREAHVTIATGVLLAAATAAAGYANSALSVDWRAACDYAAALAASTVVILAAQPAQLRSSRKLGVALGMVFCVGAGLAGGLGAVEAWFLGLLGVLAFTVVNIDAGPSRRTTTYPQTVDLAAVECSPMTRFLLARTLHRPLVHSILLEKDSRRIAYFMLVNLAFMFVQAFYAVVSGSLGLLSDSIHMLFDCAGLSAGLVAAIMSKWPADDRFPYGYGKVEVLSGLGNGIFLMIISVEIICESVERVVEGAQLRHMDELLLVSCGGLLVNVLGLVFTGHHGHHHHGHSHSHGHSHGHSHSDKNMAGIYLHILADTMGSVAVIASTLLTKYTHWYGWDPLASCAIALLIIAASYPLVVSSAAQLLLTLPGDAEWRVREALAGVSELRGVVGYAVPRFWVDERPGQEHGHGAGCGHDHDHDHGHDHHHHPADGLGFAPALEDVAGPDVLPVHSHGHDHDHDHNHGHDHHHGHDHSHLHEHKPLHDSDSLQKTPASTGPGTTPRLAGVIHIIAHARAGLDDVARRVDAFLRERGMDVVVHVEKEASLAIGNSGTAGTPPPPCWCGGAVPIARGGHMRTRSTVAM